MRGLVAVFIVTLIMLIAVSHTRWGSAWGAESSAAEAGVYVGEEKSSLTPSILALAVGRSSFKRNLGRDASPSECIQFLSECGVQIERDAIFDRMTKSEVARFLGQANLLLERGLELKSGHIKKPKEIDNWVDYCRLNGIEWPAKDEILAYF